MGWAWAAATCRGTSHIRDKTECQDTVRCISVGPAGKDLVAVVSDGAGSAPFGKQGSAITCRSISQSARSHLIGASRSPTNEEIWCWLDETRDKISVAAQMRGSSRREFAATLVALIALEHETIILHVGDGAAVCNLGAGWAAPSWPANGEYAATTFFVTDDPTADLRITRLPSPAEKIALFSDGIERLVLRFSDQTVSGPFFDKVCATVQASGRTGANSALNAGLRRHLAAPAINERTDDDKSLVVAVRL